MSATGQNASITTLLIHGFIREIKLNNKDINHIIPVSICDLCLSFYTDGYQLIFYLDETIEHKLPVIMFDKKPFKYECSLHNLTNNNNKKWYNFQAGICKSQHFEAPQSVHSNILYTAIRGRDPGSRKRLNSKSLINNYYSIFKICGKTFDNTMLKCNAILINKNELHNSNINAYNWELPTYPHIQSMQKTRGNCAIYSYNNNKLYSLGGNTKDCFNLSFDEYNNEHWKWKKMQSLNDLRATACVVNVNVKNKQKLCIIGGFGVNCTYLKTMEILDITENNDIIDDKKWKTLQYKIKFDVYESGVFYDENNCNIYLGGGCQRKKKYRDKSPMAYFSVNKKKWYYLPSTTFNHFDPVIFKDMNRLYIASCSTNAMEWIDLREWKKKSNKWTVETNDLGDFFQKTFLEFDNIRGNRFCELC